MKSSPFKTRWPCELRQFPARDDHNLAEEAEEFLCGVGFPRFFQIDSDQIQFRDEWEFLHETSEFDKSLAAGYSENGDAGKWLIIADSMGDISNYPAYYCVNQKGEVHFAGVSIEHGILTQHIAMSLDDFTECMLGLLDWHRLTSGSLATGEAVMRLLRLLNQPCFFLTKTDERCGLCLSNPANSSHCYLMSTIFHVFSADSDGPDSFPGQIDISCG